MTGSPVLSISELRQAYLDARLTPSGVMAGIRSRAVDLAADNIWIHLLSEAETAPYLDALAKHDPASLPLYGIPFAIKDNIDLAGIPTTAGCAAFSYTPDRSAFVVERLMAAGGIPVGKTNLDQFATGLVGTRSPWGATRNAFNPDYISGGSSSGSAAAVAKGLASFSLGTDTAGSGRVPAALNNLVGIKPTRGLLSNRGVVPACRSLDCVSVFALDCADAGTVMNVVYEYDAEDPYSRRVRSAGSERVEFTFGVPSGSQIEFFGDEEAEALFRESVVRMEELGGKRVAIDFQPFLDAARLLYEGPWVAERYAAIQVLIETDPDALLPVTRGIIEPGREILAIDAFKAQYRLQLLKKRADQILKDVDFILTPTTGSIYTIDEVNTDPVALNSRLGYYTNFMNLLDYAAVAVPAGFREKGLPFGVTLFAPAYHDRAICSYAARLHHAAGLTLGTSDSPVPPMPVTDRPEDDLIKIVVCGAHMEGLPLNHQLTDRDARFSAITKTAPCYRLYALSGGPPHRPGLVRDDNSGVAIGVEVWELPVGQLAGFMAGIPAPLGIGSIELNDGSWQKGFICEPCALVGARDITAYGGWRAYLSTTTTS